MARKILLADDSVTAQNMGRRILTDAGYEVTTVNNGSAALKKIAESLPELIVLDVYMPGYSGLEVCQRLKETRETARIPVLLTVGKLEPFKPEEARRARADAFIVKPFEASELLTALTKLEDKIVPQPAAAKSGQFAKVWAELEQGTGSKSEGKGEKFGDAETGWKNRLIIPTPGAKAAEPEPEEVPEKSAKGKKDKAKKEEEFKPLEVKAEHTPGVPADITPEEVAAIAAAAAAFEEKNQPPPEFAVKKSEVPEEPAATTATVQPDAVAAKPEAEKPKEEVATAVAEVPKVVEPVAEAKPEEVKLVEPAAKETTPEVPAVEIKAVAVETVPAPAANDAAVSVATTPEEKPAEKTEVAVVAAAPAVPKWVGQEVPIPPAEVGIDLAREMQNSNTVLQAAMAPVDLTELTRTETPAPAPVVEPIAAVAAPPVEEKVEEKKEEVVAPAPEPERPEEPTAAAASVPEPQPEVVTAVAAAASAGTSAQEIKLEASSQPVSTPVPSELTPSVPETKANESELAAAWAQWKEIRETVVGSQLTSQIADVAAAGLKDAQLDTSSISSTPETEETSSAGNPTAIASIVDTVLAELKPKLMEEIARKMGDDSKKKKK